MGMKKGDTKEITKTYAKDDADADLAGKTKKISVTVKAIKVRDLPALDDDLAQDVNEKYKTLDDLKKDITKGLEANLKRKIEEVKSQSLLDQLVEKNPIVLPASMVAAENEHRWTMMAQQFHCLQPLRRLGEDFSVQTVIRQHGDIHMSLLYQFRHEPVKQRQQQGGDMSSVHIRICHNNNLIVS